MAEHSITIIHYTFLKSGMTWHALHVLFIHIKVMPSHMYTHISRHTPTHMPTLTHVCALTNIHTHCVHLLFSACCHGITGHVQRHIIAANQCFRLRSVQARSNLQREGGKLKQCYQYYQHKFMMCTRYNYPSVHAKLMQSIHAVIYSIYSACTIRVPVQTWSTAKYVFRCSSPVALPRILG